MHVLRNRGLGQSEATTGFLETACCEHGKPCLDVVKVQHKYALTTTLRVTDVGCAAAMAGLSRPAALYPEGQPTSCEPPLPRFRDAPRQRRSRDEA
ncbi:Hypothetical protein MexAM1_META2p0361 (plasmid) [Methylorubrum extorquens AM1]|uniref:Uncharacterized protein n=1 Tax=Methylorubrum extorquens (strain ATCC 14718 / DSM 1338 / JCM 2805 / NCIMB 9133 / AM1) TaxID=272630 RepID=C5B443_METEA|nr:Hypothetical protein MexAM1_META2p0361 [Methylorubrum extorquens AM1]